MFPMLYFTTCDSFIGSNLHFLSFPLSHPFPPTPSHLVNIKTFCVWAGFCFVLLFFMHLVSNLIHLCSYQEVLPQSRILLFAGYFFFFIALWAQDFFVTFRSFCHCLVLTWKLDPVKHTQIYQLSNLLHVVLSFQVYT